MCSWGPSGGHGGPKQPLSLLMPWAGSGAFIWNSSVELQPVQNPEVSRDW